MGAYSRMNRIVGQFDCVLPWLIWKQGQLSVTIVQKPARTLINIAWIICLRIRQLVLPNTKTWQFFTFMFSVRARAYIMYIEMSMSNYKTTLELFSLFTSWILTHSRLLIFRTTTIYSFNSKLSSLKRN